MWVETPGSARANMFSSCMQRFSQMITYQNSKSKQMGIALLAIASVAGTAYWWWSKQPTEGSAGVVLAPSSGTAATDGPKFKVDGGVAPELQAPPAAEDGRPTDVSTEDWATLNAALAKRGQPKEEAARIVSYLRYQHGFEKWQQLDQDKDASKRRQMAQSLLNELPERLGKGEFTAIEAQMMSAVLLVDTGVEEAERNKVMEQWQTKLAGIASPLEDEQVLAAKVRTTEYKRRQAAAFDEWQAQTNPVDRTPAKLDQGLEAVQRAYNSGEF